MGPTLHARHRVWVTSAVNLQGSVRYRTNGSRPIFSPFVASRIDAGTEKELHSLEREGSHVGVAQPRWNPYRDFRQAG